MRRRARRPELRLHWAGTVPAVPARVVASASQLLESKKARVAPALAARHLPVQQGAEQTFRLVALPPGHGALQPAPAALAWSVQR